VRRGEAWTKIKKNEMKRKYKHSKRKKYEDKRKCKGKSLL